MKKRFSVSDLLATLPAGAHILGFRFRRRKGLRSGRVFARVNGEFETFMIKERRRV